MTIHHHRAKDSLVSGDYRKKRVGHITRNFFLHIHATKVHPHSLKPQTTLGLGIILGFLFLIMILTGALLLLNYSPTVEEAYNSVKDIVHLVPGGKIVRNIHRMASNAMVLVVFLHLLRVFYTGTYLGGRSTNWVIGVAMFIVVLLMSFSGYLLPWDQLSYWAVTIGSNIAASARELTDLLGITSAVDIGGFLQRMLIGDQIVGQNALTRFFMLHIVFLPLTLAILTAVHLWRIRKDGGLGRPDSETINSIEKIYSWPVVMWAELAILLALAAILVLLSFFIDAPLLEKANPAHPENPAKSPWYFLGIQELVSYSAFAGGLLVPVLYIVFLISIPYRDREDKYLGHWFSGKEGVRIIANSALFSFLVVILQLLVLIKFGWLRDWFPGISQWFVLLFNPATISVVLFIIYSYRVEKKTGSTRMSAIALFTSSVIALILYTVIGIWFRGENWDFVIGSAVF